MTTREGTAVAASALTIITLATFAGGCGTGLGSNRAACESAIEQSMACAAPAGDLPAEVDVLVSLFCTGVPETTECDDWPAFADCMSSISCGQSIPDIEAIEGCGDISTRLAENGCFPSGFGL